jgi:transcription elongation GreA/GreB family factor
MKKRILLSQVLEILRDDEIVLTNANLAAKEAATESEAKPENQYDTRALEQSYLAAGQAKRTEELREAIVRLRGLNLAAFDGNTPIEISAVITLEDENGLRKNYFLLPSQGGLKVQHEGKDFYTLSPDSPLGQSLIEKRVGDSIEVVMAGKTRAFNIVAVE